MKNQYVVSLSLLALLSLVLLNCGTKKEEPNPGSNGGNNITNVTISSVQPITGSAGDKVVITGTGFKASTTDNIIRFGTIVAIIDSASSTRLVTKVPKDALSGKLSVETGGKTATSPGDFTITQIQPGFTGTGGTANVPTVVTVNSATISSTIEKEGSRSILQHGHVWSSTKTEPVVGARVAATEGKTELGKVADNTTFPYKFSSNLKDLDPGTNYNLRAYVTTSEGTTYGPISTVSSKKPCVLASITSSYGSAVNMTYDNQYRLSASSNTTFSYNPEGLLAKYELKSAGVTVSESYSYSQGRLSKVEYQSGTVSRTTSYEYDAQGQVSKETIVAGDITTGYTYSQGVLTGITANKGAVYTVKDGNIIKIDNGNGNYTAYEFDARRNQTKIETFSAGNRARVFEYAYDDKPSVGFLLYTFKGWLPQQILKGAFLSGSNTGYNNWTQRKYQSSTSNETVKRGYTYQSNRVTGYTETVTDAITGTNLTMSFSHKYSGDCSN